MLRIQYKMVLHTSEMQKTCADSGTDDDAATGVPTK